MSDCEVEQVQGQASFDLDEEFASDDDRAHRSDDEEAQASDTKPGRKRKTPDKTVTKPRPVSVAAASRTDTKQGRLYAKTLNVKDLSTAFRCLTSIPDCDFVNFRFTDAGMEMTAQTGVVSALLGHVFFGKTPKNNPNGHTSAFTDDYRCEGMIDVWVTKADLTDLQEKIKPWELIEIAYKDEPKEKGLRFCGVLPYDVGGSGRLERPLIARDVGREPILPKCNFGWHLFISGNKLKTNLNQLLTKTAEVLELRMENKMIKFTSAGSDGDTQQIIECDIDDATFDKNLNCACLLPLKYFKHIATNLGRIPHSTIEISFNVDQTTHESDQTTPEITDQLMFTHYFDNAEPRSQLSFWMCAN